MDRRRRALGNILRELSHIASELEEIATSTEKEWLITNPPGAHLTARAQQIRVCCEDLIAEFKSEKDKDYERYEKALAIALGHNL